MRSLLVIPFALVLAAFNDGSGSRTNAQQPQNPNFTFSYSSPSMGSRCDDFEWSNGSAHYCSKKMPVRMGQTITLTFTLTGDVYPIEAADSPPAALRLFLWRAGDNMTCAGDYQQFRFWTGKVDLTPGTHMISAKVDPALWTDCYGQPGSVKPALFQALLNNIAGVGYTFGGQSFAGHGVAKREGGSAHFTVNSFTVQ
jgi:hypothetical protein